MMKTLDRISQHSFLPEYVRRDATVLDLGGNQGDFLFPVAERYGLRAVAVEPVPELVGWIRGNGGEVIHAAVADKDGEVELTYDLGQAMTGSILGSEVVHLLDVAAAERVTVPAVTLASLIRQTGPVSLLKVDIEGAELDMLLKTDPEVLRGIDQIAVEFHDFWYPALAERTEKAKARLQSLGFRMIRFTPNNKDVLFINERLNVPAWKMAYVGLWLRNLNGAWRAGRVIFTNLRNKLFGKPKYRLPSAPAPDPLAMPERHSATVH